MTTSDSRSRLSRRRSTAAPGNSPSPHGHGVLSIARALSRLGHCSRSEAASLIAQQRVRVNGRLLRATTLRVDPERDRIDVDGKRVVAHHPLYLMLNKPRGLVTTTSDEQGRDTVYTCLRGHALPWLSPVGRLDKASEGLLLFTNDTRWADRLLSPARHVERVYHVQIDRLPDAALLAAMERGITHPRAGALRALAVRELRRGDRNAWLEVVLDEGRNRQIRRLLEALGVQVRRLVRVAIGPLALGTLASGRFRALTTREMQALDLAMRGAAEAAGSRRLVPAPRHP